jgi:filamentous hemagglutinin family protein
VRSGAKAGYTHAALLGRLSNVIAGDWQTRVLLNGQGPATRWCRASSSAPAARPRCAASASATWPPIPGFVANVELYTPNLCGARGLAMPPAGLLRQRLGRAQPHRCRANCAAPRSRARASACASRRAATASVQLDYGHGLHTGQIAATSKNKLHVRVAWPTKGTTMTTTSINAADGAAPCCWPPATGRPRATPRPRCRRWCGQATFNQQGNVFSITNTPGAIINWQSFNVGAGEVTRFIQQSSDSAVLNRIVGQDPTKILGALQSNGKVFLINPNGILFGQGARVDVNGLVASTLNMSTPISWPGRRTSRPAPRRLGAQ